MPPQIDIRSIPYLQQQLREGKLVILGDVHDSPLARVLVKELLATGSVKRFFIEAPYNLTAGSGSACRPHAADFGETLQDALDRMCTRRTEEASALRALSGGGYFSIKLGKTYSTVGGGAKPDLVDLAAFAVSRNINVIPADANPNEILAALAAADGQQSEVRLFQDEGLGARDRFASQHVADYLRRCEDPKGSLLLWGKNHLRGTADRTSLPDLLLDAGISCNSTPEISSFYSSVK